jgi:hypothetical protein
MLPFISLVGRKRIVLFPATFVRLESGLKGRGGGELRLEPALVLLDHFCAARGPSRVFHATRARLAFGRLPSTPPDRLGQDCPGPFRKRWHILIDGKGRDLHRACDGIKAEIESADMAAVGDVRFGDTRIKRMVMDLRTTGRTTPRHTEVPASESMYGRHRF